MAPSAVDSKTDGSAAGQAKQQPVDLGSGDPSLAHVEESVGHAPVFADKMEERRFLKHRLALAFRIFATHGFMEGIAGHITVRDPVDPSSFWVNPFGLHFALVTDDDLIRVDHEGKVIEGGKNRMLNYGG